jgi:hypothetical protein
LVTESGTQITFVAWEQSASKTAAGYFVWEMNFFGTNYHPRKSENEKLWANQS